MFKIGIGVVIGFFLAIAALNPADAKRMLGGAVDTVHNEYQHQTAVRSAEPNKMVKSDEVKPK
jgi:hypothetical protein